LLQPDIPVHDHIQALLPFFGPANDHHLQQRRKRVRLCRKASRFLHTSALFLVPDVVGEYFQRRRERQNPPSVADRGFSQEQFDSMTGAIEI
jgi:hypothetical protein